MYASLGIIIMLVKMSGLFLFQISLLLLRKLLTIAVCLGYPRKRDEMFSKGNMGNC